MGDEAVAPFGYRFDEARRRRIIAKRTPNASHRLIQAKIEVDKRVLGPDSFFQLFAGDYLSRVLQQSSQNFEGLILKLDFDSALM